MKFYEILIFFCIYDDKIAVTQNYFSRLFHLLCIPLDFQEKNSHFHDNDP